MKEDDNDNKECNGKKNDIHDERVVRLETQIDREGKGSTNKKKRTTPFCFFVFWKTDQDSLNLCTLQKGLKK